MPISRSSMPYQVTKPPKSRKMAPKPTKPKKNAKP